MAEPTISRRCQINRELDFGKLRHLAYKLRCLGYLVETQDPNHVHPADFDEAQYGLALFLNEITAEIIEICESAEEVKEYFLSGTKFKTFRPTQLN